MTDTLFTAADDTEVLAVTSEATVTASTESRTITGLVAPYGKPGATSAGLVTILPGAIRLPEPLSRVKLLGYHTGMGTPPEPVGVAISADDRADGLYMTFKIAETRAGDEALTLAASGVKDGFSVELIRTDVHRDEVRGGDLTAVAHVPHPAYDDARVTSVAAAHHPEGNTPMKLTPEQIARLAALRAQETLTQTEATELAELVALEAQVDADADAEAVEVEVEETAAPELVSAAAHAPATVRATRTASAGTRVTSLNAMYDAVRRLNMGERSPELTAALADVVYSGSPFADTPAWVGELWSGNPYRRKFVELLQQRDLTSMKVTGWRWVTPPEVDDWAGDKTEVPSNPVAIEDAGATAARLAGAWDVDRAYWDFGNTEFIQSFYAKQTESYAIKSDAKAEAAIVATATGTTAITGGTVPLLKAAATAAAEVEANTNGYEATAIVVNTQDKLDLIDVAQLDVPAYLKDILNIDPRNFVGSSSVPAGTVVALAKPSLSFYELPGVPIRVDAIDLARGGRDSGVFGYWATMAEFANGVRKVTFGGV